MKILSNKFFIIGNLILLLIAIPVTLFFVKKQQEVRSKAAASSKLYFAPSSINTSTTCQSFNVDVMVDPGTNIVNVVKLYITYDPTLLSVSQITPSDAFKETQSAASITSGAANIGLSTGFNATSVSSVTKVATITFIPKGTGTAQIQFDGTQTAVYSTAKADGAVENVLQIGSLAPANATIGSAECLSGPTGSVTPTGTGSITPTGSIAPTGTPSVTTTTSPTPSAATLAPTCTSLLASPSTGNAPLAVLFTGQGSDPNANGLITKATFTFGDGQTQDVTTGLNLKTVNTQTSHTYQTSGSFTATVLFTNNQSATSQISQACSQSINVTAASGSATLTPTATLIPTATPTLVEKPTATPTLVEKPTIAQTGSVAQTMGTLGVIIMSIVGGFFLLTL